MVWNPFNDVVISKDQMIEIFGDGKSYRHDGRNRGSERDVY